MLDMRLGNSGDIPFIMNLVRDGVTSGAFFYAEGNGLETVRSELQSVTQQYRDNRGHLRKRKIKHAKA